MAVLALLGVSAGYGRTDVVHDVSLSVAAGEVVALIGPNGAGKTTLLRAAAGILRPTAGSVVVDGRDLAGIPPREAALLLSGVPQDDATEFAFVGNNVMRGMARITSMTRSRSPTMRATLASRRARFSSAIVAAISLIAFSE